MRPEWDNQFRETEGERRERWQKTRADCTCPNVKHAPIVEMWRAKGVPCVQVADGDF